MHRTRANQSSKPSLVVGALVPLLLLCLGSWASPATAQLDPGVNDILCGNTDFSREIAASPELVADIEGMMAQIGSLYGDSIEKAQPLFEDDADLMVATCTALLGNAHVIKDFKGNYQLIDEQETFLGDWRPGILTAEVTRDGFALACHFADVGSSGDKVLYAPHSLGLFNSAEELTYLAELSGGSVYVAIDPDGNRLGSPLDPLGDSGGSGTQPTSMTREQCMDSGPGSHWSGCYGGAMLRNGCTSCCAGLARACRDHANDPDDIYAFWGIKDNIENCLDECKELPTSAQATLSTP